MQFQSVKLSKIKTKADLLVHDAMMMKITQISIENVFQNSRKMTKESRRKEAKIENSNTLVLFSGKNFLYLSFSFQINHKSGCTCQMFKV